MSSADLLLLALITFFAVKGMINGLVSEAIGILGVILAFLFSYMAFTPIHKVVVKFISKPELATVMAYILAFMLIYIIVVLIGINVNKFINFIKLGFVNRILGLIFGAMKGLVIISIILWGVIYVVPKTAPIVNEIKQSKVSNFAMKIVPKGYDFLISLSKFDRANPFKK